VLVIDISSQVRIQVPIMGCCTPGCSCRTAAQPLELSCWPSNPRAAQDLTTAPPSREQTWFTLRLMAFANFMVMIARRVPMYRWVNGPSCLATGHCALACRACARWQ
jgi:hypothetical protein